MRKHTEDLQYSACVVSSCYFWEALIAAAVSAAASAGTAYATQPDVPSFPGAGRQQGYIPAMQPINVPGVASQGGVDKILGIGRFGVQEDERKGSDVRGTLERAGTRFGKKLGGLSRS